MALNGRKFPIAHEFKYDLVIIKVDIVAFYEEIDRDKIDFWSQQHLKADPADPATHAYFLIRFSIDCHKNTMWNNLRQLVTDGDTFLGCGFGPKAGYLTVYKNRGKFYCPTKSQAEQALSKWLS